MNERPPFEEKTMNIEQNEPVEAIQNLSATLELTSVEDGSRLRQILINDLYEGSPNNRSEKLQARGYNTSHLRSVGEKIIQRSNTLNESIKRNDAWEAKYSREIEFLQAMGNLQETSSLDLGAMSEIWRHMRKLLVISVADDPQTQEAAVRVYNPPLSKSQISRFARMCNQAPSVIESKQNSIINRISDEAKQKQYSTAASILRKITGT